MSDTTTHIPEGRAANVVAGLLEAAQSSLRGDGDQVQALLARVNALLCPDALAKAASESPNPIAPIKGLAPWQSRAVAAYVDAHLAGPIQIVDMANVVRLSNSHFHRAF